MTSFISQLSEGLADAVATAGQSIVRVEGRRRLPASGIVWSSDGLIVTAHHVVEQNDDITIGLPDGSTATATVVGRDPTTDLALLRTNVQLTPPTWVEADNLRVGHLALAVGRPGDHLQSTLGVISALEGEWRTGAGGRIEPYLQTDVVMYPGFSGGPLVSVTGEVIALNSSALARGVSVSVPVPTLRRVIGMLEQHGRVRRGYLGVGVQTVRLPESVATQLDQETGVLLTSVEPGGAADQGGLMLGDTIVALAGGSVRNTHDLQAQLSSDYSDKPVAVRILRGGQVQELALTIGERS